MAEMTGPLTWYRWPETGTLATQADIDQCADELLAQGIGSHVVRSLDAAENPVRSIDIHQGHAQDALTATTGQIVVLLTGRVQVLTEAEYAAGGFPS